MRAQLSEGPELFAVVAPGLEGVAEAELARRGFAVSAREVGGLGFRGDPLLANRTLALPTRILQRVATFRARAFDELSRGAAAVDWRPFGGLTVEQVSCRKSRLYHSGAVAERLRAAVPEGPVPLHARLLRDLCTLSVDASGERLHQRGWRVEGGAAPLRETLAAGVLALAGWAPGEALFDPMCGSGTFLVEAAGAAAGLAPGRLRAFACEAWCAPSPMPLGAAVATVIAGSDRARPQIEVAARNAARAGVEIALACQDAREARAPAPTGLLVCNPPYGRRAAGPGPAFAALRALLAGPFGGWRAAVLCPSPSHAAALGLRESSTIPLKNGGLPVWLALGRGTT